MNVVGTDKTGTACYQISSHFLSVLRRCAHFAIDSDIFVLLATGINTASPHFVLSNP